MKSKKLLLGILAILFAATLGVVGCDLFNPPPADDENGNGNSIAVTLSGVSANGSSSQVTTQLTLTFSQAITGLTASDISLSGVSGVSKGTLSGSGPNYTLPISGFIAGGTLSVSVSKTGYTISGSPKTVPIYVVSGTSGDFTYTETDSIIITKYNGTGGSVSIPAQINGKPVTRIADKAFNNCTGLTSITIPNSVIFIGESLIYDSGVFNGCTGLTSITIPDSVIFLGEKAFQGCTNLSSITLGNSVASIGIDAFRRTKITSITFPASLTTISGSIFENTNVTSITFNGTRPTGINSNAFDGDLLSKWSAGGAGTYTTTSPASYSSVWTKQGGSGGGDGGGEVTGPKITITDIPEEYNGKYVFFSGRLADGFQSVYIPDITKPVNTFTFTLRLISNGSVSLPTWRINDTATGYVRYTGNDTFYGAGYIFDSVTPTNISLSYIGVIYFGMNNTPQITFTNGSATKAWSEGEFQFNPGGDGVGTFSNFYYIESTNAAAIIKYNGNADSLTIPAEINGKPVTRIGDGAFKDCTILTSVTIPASVTSIGDRIADGDLVNKYLAANGGPGTYTRTNTDSARWTKQGNAEEESSVGTFTSIDALAKWLRNEPANTADTAYTIKLNVSSLGSNSIASGSVGKALKDNNTKFVNLDLSDSTFTSIGNGAFYTCSNLTGVTIPDSVTRIEAEAFYNTGLTSVNIPDGVTIIANSTFQLCTRLASVTIPDSVTSIGSQAFTSCQSLASVTIPSNVTSIGNSAFSGCDKLSSLTIENGVTTIVSNAFENCSSLTSLTIPASVTKIEGGAFWGCRNLASVTFESKIDSNNWGTGVNPPFDNGYPIYSNLNAVYTATTGGIGTYKRVSGNGTQSSSYKWEKQE
jgi:hypothetical protein